MFYYITVDTLGKITQTLKSSVELNDNPALIRVMDIVDIHNDEGKEYYYNAQTGVIYFEYSLDTLKRIAWSRCKELYENSINRGFLYKGVLYDANDNSRMAILNARLAAIDVTWTTYNNTTVFLTSDEFAEFHASLTEWFSLKHSALQVRRNAINNAASVDDVLAILESLNVSSHE